MRHQLVAASARFAGAITALVLASTASGQSTPAQKPGAGPLHLRGFVLDKTSHDSVAGAQIILDADGRFVTSDSTGAYDFEDIPKGEVALTIRAQRFAVAHYALRLIG